MSLMAYKDVPLEVWLRERVREYDNHTLVFTQSEYLFGPRPAAEAAFGMYNAAHPGAELKMKCSSCYFKVMNWLRRNPQVITKENCTFTATTTT